MAGPAPGRPMVEIALAAVQQQIEHRRVQDRRHAVGLPRGGRAGEGENAGADDRADAERDQAPRPECLGEPLGGLLGGGDQRVDALGAVEQTHRRRFALGQDLHLLLVGAARHVGGALGLGSRLLARGALQLLAFCFVGDFLGVHSSILIPAYFSHQFLQAVARKADRHLGVVAVAFPAQDRAAAVLRVLDRRARAQPFLRGAGLPAACVPGFAGELARGGYTFVVPAAGGLACCATGGFGAPVPDGGGPPTGGLRPRSAKNCAMFSTEL